MISNVSRNPCNIESKRNAQIFTLPMKSLQRRERKLRVGMIRKGYCAEMVSSKYQDGFWLKKKKLKFNSTQCWVLRGKLSDPAEWHKQRHGGGGRLAGRTRKVA